MTSAHLIHIDDYFKYISLSTDLLRTYVRTHVYTAPPAPSTIYIIASLFKIEKSPMLVAIHEEKAVKMLGSNKRSRHSELYGTKSLC